MLTPGISLITVALGSGTSRICKNDKDGIGILTLMIKNKPREPSSLFNFLCVCQSEYLFLQGVILKIKFAKDFIHSLLFSLCFFGREWKLKIKHALWTDSWVFQSSWFKTRMNNKEPLPQIRFWEHKTPNGTDINLFERVSVLVPSSPLSQPGHPLMTILTWLWFCDSLRTTITDACFSGTSKKQWNVRSKMAQQGLLKRTILE